MKKRAYVFAVVVTVALSVANAIFVGGAFRLSCSAAANDEIENGINETFDPLFYEWTTFKGDQDAFDSDDDETHLNYARIKAPDKENNAYYKKFNPIYGGVVELEYDFMADSSSNYKYICLTNENMDYTYATTYIGLKNSVRYQGRFRFKNMLTKNFAADEWHHLKYVLNLDNKTYDIYYDNSDKPTVSDKIYGDNIYIDRLFINLDAGSGYLCVDNIKLSGGESAPLEDEFDISTLPQYIVAPMDDGINTETLTFKEEDLKLTLEERFYYPDIEDGIIPQGVAEYGNFQTSGKFPTIKMYQEENGMPYASIKNETGSTSVTGLRYDYLNEMLVADLDVRFMSGTGQIRIAKGSINGTDVAARVDLEGTKLSAYNRDGSTTLLAENIEKNKWYHFRFVVNIDKQIWRLTINDSDKIVYATPEGESFIFKDVGIDMLRMSAIGINPTVNGEIHVANLRIQSAPLYEARMKHSTTTLPEVDNPLTAPIFSSEELLAVDKTEAQPTEDGSCKLVDNGDGTVTVKNGICTFTFVKARGDMIKMNYNGGKNLLTSIADTTKGYYGAASQIDGAKQASTSDNFKFSVVRETDDLIELSFLSDDVWEHLGYILDMRFVIRRGVSGIYQYMLLSLDDDMIDAGHVVSLEDTGYKVRTDRKVFPYYYIDDERYGEFHQPEAAREEILDATFRYVDGYVGGKYNNVVYTKNDHVDGVCNDKVGFWLVKASTEDIPGGINKPELSVENGIVQWYNNSGHGGTPRIYPKKGWKKVCGPVLYYINEAENKDALWEDAKQQYEKEHSQWPYQWVTDDAYMADSRGSLHGKVKITDGTNPEGSWAIVADSEPHWQLQGEHYQYTAQIDANGEFTVENIHPGVRTLYLVVNGVIEEYKIDDIIIKANETTDIGTIEWTPKTNGKRLWQIGIPDGTPDEFRSTLDPIGWGYWIVYAQEFPNGVDFKIGESDEKKDWNFCFPAARTNGLIQDFDYGYYVEDGMIKFDSSKSELADIEIATTIIERMIPMSHYKHFTTKEREKILFFSSTRKNN